MAQVQPISTSYALRPNTPPERLRPINAPRMSPSRMPDPLVTSPTFRSGGHVHLDTFSPVNQNGSFEFDRVIKSGKVLRRIKKKGAWKPSWKPAYLVLRPNLLSVYKNEKETELKASITLSEVTAVARVKKTNTDNVFGIFTSAKNFHFSGFFERDTSDWVALIRMEARTDQDAELDLPTPGFNASTADPHESETTDFSAEDETERPGSPEAPNWSVRGSKSRSNTQTGQRKLSSLREYSANEQYTTSQSDFSDVAATGLSSSVPRTQPLTAPAGQATANKLTTIPTDTTIQKPANIRSTSQTSLQGLATSAPAQSQQNDPNRVIRQGYLQLHKTISGVRQWKTIWVVLRASTLALYKSTSEYEPIKIVPIHNLIDAAELDPITKSKRHCFQVIGEEKTWKFNVESERELEEWLGALKSVLVKRTRGLSSAHGAPPASVPVPVPGAAAAAEHAKDVVVPTINTSSPPVVVSRASQRNDPTGLDDIVEGVDELKVS